MSISDIETYFNKLRDKLKEKELMDFWIFSDRTDFKPIKNITKKQMQTFLLGKARYYSGKNVANVCIIFRPRVNFNLDDDKNWIFTIKITIFQISDEGKIDTDIADSWELNINYNKKELSNNHFSINELDTMIKIASERKVISDMGGIFYSSWIKSYNNALKKQRKTQSKNKNQSKRQSKRQSKNKTQSKIQSKNKTQSKRQSKRKSKQSDNETNLVSKAKLGRKKTKSKKSRSKKSKDI
jgi:hypothetical protein